MIIDIIMTAIFLVAVIFLIGQLLYIPYLFLIPSDKLSIEDFGKKNLFIEYFKNIKIIYQKPNFKNDWVFILIPDISFSYVKLDRFNKIVYYLEFGWLFWIISFKYSKKIIN